MKVLQDWVCELPMMQQSVLMAAIRGPDGLPKYGSVKMLLRWYRRCILLSAIDGRVLTNPYDENGGSFTGPSLKREMSTVGDWTTGMDRLMREYIRELDAIPHHFQLHFLHAAEIVGYKHPDSKIAAWWRVGVYGRLVNDMHLCVESEFDLDRRLGDTRSGWLERADEATID